MNNKQEWLLEQIAKFPTLSARELTAKLNDKVLVDNPEPQQQVPQLFTMEEIQECCTPEEKLSIYKIPNFVSDVRNACANKNLFGLYVLLTIISNEISTESYAKLQNLLKRTIPDPTYESKLLKSPAELAGFGLILVNEVEELL